MISARGAPEIDDLVLALEAPGVVEGPSDHGDVELDIADPLVEGLEREALGVGSCAFVDGVVTHVRHQTSRSSE